MRRFSIFFVLMLITQFYSRDPKYGGSYHCSSQYEVYSVYLPCERYGYENIRGSIHLIEAFPPNMIILTDLYMRITHLQVSYSCHTPVGQGEDYRRIFLSVTGLHGDEGDTAVPTNSFLVNI